MLTSLFLYSRHQLVAIPCPSGGYLTPAGMVFACKGTASFSCRNGAYSMYHRLSACLPDLESMLHSIDRDSLLTKPHPPPIRRCRSMLMLPHRRGGAANEVSDCAA